ncbi:MAG: SGNH/GDSL hydrolase family protein [Bryobacteraceae bacterium]
MEWYEAEVRELEKALSQRALPPNPVAFYGSSTIRLWDNLAGDLADTRALNLGFGGSTLEACAYFFERLVLPIKPSSLVVYAGDNDLGDGRKPREVLSFFRALAEKVDRDLGPVEFAFISIKPSPARFELMNRIRKTNRFIQDALAAHPNYYFINVFDAMLDKGGRPQSKLFTDDGLHMSREGYHLWAKLFSPYRNRIFTINSLNSTCSYPDNR